MNRTQARELGFFSLKKHIQDELANNKPIKEIASECAVAESFVIEVSQGKVTGILPPLAEEDRYISKFPKVETEDE